MISDGRRLNLQLKVRTRMTIQALGSPSGNPTTHGTALRLIVVLVVVVEVCPSNANHFHISCQNLCLDLTVRLMCMSTQ